MTHWTRLRDYFFASSLVITSLWQQDFIVISQVFIKWFSGAYSINNHILFLSNYHKLIATCWTWDPGAVTRFSVSCSAAAEPLTSSFCDPLKWSHVCLWLLITGYSHCTDINCGRLKLKVIFNFSYCLWCDF